MNKDKPYKQADAIFFLMKKLGFDPVKDIRIVEDLEDILKESFVAGYKRGLKEAGSDLV